MCTLNETHSASHFVAGGFSEEREKARRTCIVASRNDAIAGRIGNRQCDEGACQLCEVMSVNCLGKNRIEVSTFLSTNGEIWRSERHLKQYRNHVNSLNFDESKINTATLVIFYVKKPDRAQTSVISIRVKIFCFRRKRKNVSPGIICRGSKIRVIN